MGENIKHRVQGAEYRPGDKAVGEMHNRAPKMPNMSRYVAFRIRIPVRSLTDDACHPAHQGSNLSECMKQARSLIAATA